MPVDANVKVYFKNILPAILGIAGAGLCIYQVGDFGDYFAAHPVLFHVFILKSLGVDVFGAIVPIAVGLTAIALFIKYFESAIKKFAPSLIISAVFGFLLFQMTDEGVAGSPAYLALATSIAAVALNYLPAPRVNTKKKYVASLLLAVGCVPLSLFAVDLFYSRYFASSVIGGNGLSDAILSSTLYAPLCVTIVASVLIYLSQTSWLIKKQFFSKKSSAALEPSEIEETR